MLTTFDFKGGFANTNIGFVYLQNVTRGSAVDQLFAEFERRVEMALPMPKGLTPGQLHAHTTRFLWDQNLFNKVLLSEMHGRPVFLPIESADDARYHAEHRKELRARLYWREGTLPTPARFQRLPPWGETTERYLWYELRDKRPPQAAVPAHETVALAPAWVIALEQGFGLKGKHWLYGATPPPTAIVHYTCTTQTEDARIWPLRLFGSWHAQAVEAELGSTAQASTAASAVAWPGEAARHRARPRLIALADATYENPLPARSWARLNLVHGLLGGLASLSGRTLVAPATNCTGARGDRFVSPTRGPRPRSKSNPPLSSRCFWHVHSPHGVRCVLRLGHCTAVAAPGEAEAARSAMAAAGKTPAVITLDWRHLSSDATGRSTLAAPRTDALDRLTAQPLADEELVLVRLLLSDDDLAAPPGALLERVRKHAHGGAVELRLRTAIKAFARQCPDLVSGPACNNICS